jgi:hypothetical protein
MSAWHDCVNCIHARLRVDGLLYCEFSGQCIEFWTAKCKEFKKTESEGEHD